MKTYSKNDISDRMEIAPGLIARVEIERDEFASAPWEDCDGRGPVTDWTSRNKYPGERVLASSHGAKRFYDFAGAMAIAKRDGWGISEEKRRVFEAGMGRPMTKGELLAAAVESDFQYLRGWCADDWQYVSVTVTLEDENGRELLSDSIGGVEDLDGYDLQQAAEMLNALLSNHAEKQAAQAVADAKEQTERAHWEARDTVTV